MAMIKCPECGQEISDQATTCPHCGVKIFVCPECGHINLGNGSCKLCGYVLPEEKATSPDSNKDESKKNLFERWNESVPEEKTKKIIFGVLSACLMVIPLIYGLVWVFQSFDNYLNITPEKYLRAMASYASDVARLDTLFYMLVFMYIISIVMNVLVAFFRDFNFGKWIRSNRIDISQAINSAISRSAAKKEKKDDDEEFSLNREIREAKEEKNIERMDSACFIATNPNKAYLLAVIQFVSELAWCVLEIFFACWGKDMIMSFMRSVIYGKFETDSNGVTIFTNNFKIDWWPFLLWAGIILAVAILIQVATKKIKKRIIVKTLMKVQKKS